MRIECDYCLAVYESDDSENERAPCPFCASRPDRSTAREFKAAPSRPRVSTSPFGIESQPPMSSARISIVCPPASRSLDEPPRHGAETPAYVRIADEVPETERMKEPPVHVHPVDSQAPTRPGTSAEAPADRTSNQPPSLPAIQLPPIGSAERHRPAYDWTVPQVPPSAPRIEERSEARPESVPQPRLSPASDPSITEELRFPENRVPRDTDRPFVRSDRSPPDGDARRRKAALWGPAVLGAIGAAFLLRGWLSSSNEPDAKQAPAPVSVASMLVTVDQSVSVGDIDQAVAALDRATRVAPRDPAVLLSRAKLAVERADAAWLIRRATPGAPSDGANYEDFVRAAGEARSTSEEAVRALPGSDDARRVLVNALRIFGEIDRGREIAAALQDRTSPETSYALATLDLMSPGVPPEGAAARLKQNAWVGGIPGKGRATLVYALVRAGDLDGANTEIDKLALLARLHPASAALRALIDTTRATATPPPAPAPKRAKPSATKLCPEDFKARHKDAHSIVREAVNARCRGDVDGARKLYQSILDVTPSDPEALCGMGDIARQEDNWDTARNFYAEALRANASFMPAALGAADVEWEVGNLPVAQRKYREILDAFPNATTPPRVQERAAPPTRGAKGS
jgi:tetratricopeptide (TPR) repeat protein